MWETKIDKKSLLYKDWCNVKFSEKSELNYFGGEDVTCQEVYRDKYFDEVYLHDFINHTIDCLEKSDEYYVGIDVKFVFSILMNCDARFVAECGNPKYLNWPSYKWFWYLEEVGLLNRNEYPSSSKTVDYYGDALNWFGKIWTLLCFKYKIHSKILLKFLSFDDLMHFFVTCHERSWDDACEFIYNSKLKENI